MTYRIQENTVRSDDWTTIDNTGDDLDVMKAAVDELIIAAAKGNTGSDFRLVDEGGQVVYAPTEEEVGFPADDS